MSSSKKVTLRSDDGKTFEVDAMVAARSQTIKHMIEDDCAFNVIPLPNVSGNILSMVIEYCKKHSESESEVAATAIDDDLKAWDASFLNVNMDTIFSLMLAANYLNVKSLLDLTCQNVADIIKGKTVDEIRSTFNIKNDFTPAEEAEIRMENEWAFV